MTAVGTYNGDETARNMTMPVMYDDHISDSHFSAERIGRD